MILYGDWLALGCRCGSLHRSDPAAEKQEESFLFPINQQEARFGVSSAWVVACQKLAFFNGWDSAILQSKSSHFPSNHPM